MKNEYQILVVRVVMMSLLDGDIERCLAAFLDKNGEDINDQAQHFAEERGAVLLHMDAPQSAVLYNEELEND